MATFISLVNFTDQGKENLPASVYNVYQGEAVACSFEMKPEKGKWKKDLRGWLMLQEQARKLDDKPTVWFADACRINNALRFSCSNGVDVIDRTGKGSISIAFWFTGNNKFFIPVTRDIN